MCAREKVRARVKAVLQVRLGLCVLMRRHKNLPHKKVDLAVLRISSERLSSGGLGFLKMPVVQVSCRQTGQTGNAIRVQHQEPRIFVLGFAKHLSLLVNISEQGMNS